jgi:hypothetical protein
MHQIKMELSLVKAMGLEMLLQLDLIQKKENYILKLMMVNKKWHLRIQILRMVDM